MYLDAVIFEKFVFFKKSQEQAMVCESVMAMRRASADSSKPFLAAVATEKLKLERSEAIFDCTGGNLVK